MKKFCLLQLCFILLAELAFAQFYKDLSQEKRKELAEAYYLVGSQYLKTGKATMGKGYQALAYKIYPQLDTAMLSLEETTPAAALIAEGRGKIVAPPQSLESVSRLIRARFLQLISALVSEDVEATLETLDGSVYLTKAQREVTQEEMRKELEAFFAGASLLGLAPSQVYDLNSLEIGPAAAVPPSWGDTYTIRIEAREDFSQQVVIWEKEQQFLIHRIGRDWRIFAVGRGLPPASWVPRQAQAPAAAKAAREAPGAESQSIKSSFMDCLDAFLKKDLNRAAGHFSRGVQILRLNTTLSRGELTSTFQGYFEDSDFSNIKPQDVLEPDSVFVERTDKFKEVKTLPTYLLTVKTRLDLSDKIPFWTRFQEYYFIQEEDAWRIFAIF